MPGQQQLMKKRHSLYRLTSFEREVPSTNVGNPGQPGYVTKKDYVIDGVQNWTSVITNGVTQNNSVNNTEAYTAFGTATPSYDADGNMTSPDSSAAQVITLKYDFLNRLRQVVKGTSVVQHTYDAEGRRVRTTTTNAGGPAAINYVYDGWEVVEEYDDSSTLQRKWIMGKDIDEPLQVTFGNAYTHPGTYEFQRSTLGNVVALTDTGGAVRERYTYDSYGTPQFENASNANQNLTQSDYGNPYLFNGRRYDPWIYPMYEYRTRMYSPGMGRFVQRDSIGVWGDVDSNGNAYSFAANNPIDYTDSFGLDVYVYQTAITEENVIDMLANAFGIQHKAVGIEDVSGTTEAWGGHPVTTSHGDTVLKIRPDTVTDKKGNLKPGFRRKIVPPPYGATQAEWDAAVRRAAEAVRKMVNEAEGGVSDNPPEGGSTHSDPKPGPHTGPNPSAHENPKPNPGPGGRVDPKYPYNARPYGYHCWWTVDEILSRAEWDILLHHSHFWNWLFGDTD